MEFLYKLYANSCFCRKKCIFLKRILALPMLGQIRTVSELQPFTFDTFDLGHPVHSVLVILNFTTALHTKLYCIQGVAILLTLTLN